MSLHHFLVRIGADYGGYVSGAEKPIYVHFIRRQESFQCGRQQFVRRKDIEIVKGLLLGQLNRCRNSGNSCLEADAQHDHRMVSMLSGQFQRIEAGVDHAHISAPGLFLGVDLVQKCPDLGIGGDIPHRVPIMDVSHLSGLVCEDLGGHDPTVEVLPCLHDGDAITLVAVYAVEEDGVECDPAGTEGDALDSLDVVGLGGVGEFVEDPNDIAAALTDGAPALDEPEDRAANPSAGLALLESEGCLVCHAFGGATDAQPTDDGAVISRTASDLLTRASLREPVRLLGVGATNLGSQGSGQLALFPPSETQDRRTRLNRALDEIEARFGSAAVTRGSRDAAERAGLSLQIKRGETD